MRADWRLALATVVATLAAFAAFVAVSVFRDVDLAARLVSASLLFLVPGIAIVHGLFARHDLTLFARTVLALSFGLCAMVLGGWLLSVLGVPLDRLTWLALLGLFTVVPLLATARRAPSPEPPIRPEAPSRGAVLDVLAGLCAIAIAFQVLSVVRDPALVPEPTRFTQLWIVPGAATELEIGVRNAEGAAMTYDVVVGSAGSEGARVTVVLADRGAWSARIARPSASSDVVEVRLYRSGDAVPYRRVVWRP